MKKRINRLNQKVKSYRKPKTVRKRFKQIVDYLDLPDIKLIVRKQQMNKKGDAIGLFSTGKEGKPYIILWKEGWDDQTIKHELTHYVQYLVDGQEIFVTDNTDDDLFEKEARVCQDLPKDVFKEYVKFRLEYKDF